MFIRKFVICTAVPLLWSAMALAEGPSPDQMPPPHQHDHAAFHKEMCGERFAHQSARLAYLEAKLDLTDKQRQAWTKWSQWRIDSAAKERSACLEDKPKADTRPTVLDQEAQMEKVMTIRLQGLQAERAPLQALYDVLTPEQRAIFDRAALHRQNPGWGHHHQ